MGPVTLGSHEDHWWQSDEGQILMGMHCFLLDEDQLLFLDEYVKDALTVS